ncbi:WAP four-disulfide core domain protein 13 [Acomys russatus]|uniref:WAP four-disulfide core domain protein 13 n=1 Tax=Acomys russatus TaxID=60746 RepID=UPI0021E32FAE|nr:WAP four-disulfide core domain protein 13 [Acomys russatus]
MTPASLLRLLLVLTLAPQPVPASPRQYFLKYILEPPPCRSEPQNCNTFCTQQEECPGSLQCCSAYCGIVCSSNLAPKKRTQGPPLPTVA